MKSRLKHILWPILIIVGLIILNSLYHERLDLTKDKRFTLSKQSKELLTSIDQAMYVQVLLDGDLPAEFRKLKLETRQLLEELSNINSNLKFEFINPIADLNQNETDRVAAQLAQEGMKPAVASVQEAGKNTKVLLFPYAKFYYNEKQVVTPLLKSVAGASAEERVNSSIQQLEYQLIDALKRVSTKKSKTIAVLRDSGNLTDRQLQDFLQSIQSYYKAAPYAIEFLNDNDSVQPQKVLNSLKKFDLVVAPKPTKPYSEIKKYILDQYLIDGGKMLMAVDPIIMEDDSLSNSQAKAYALPRSLNIDEMLFSYGLRLKTGLVRDEKFAPIALAVGQGRNTQYEAFPWPYYPVSNSTTDTTQTAQSIIKNLEDVKFEYAGTIDTLKNDIEKTVLLTTSKATQLVTLPAAVSLNEIEKPINSQAFNSTQQPLAVLAQGNFKSAYKNRVKPIMLKEHLDYGKSGALVLISDGDIMKNQIIAGQVQELGYDIKTGMSFGNKEFLMNTINYLLDDSGLISLRNKDIIIPFLNVQKTYNDRLQWQLINVIIPLVFVALLAAIFLLLRKRKYSKK
ncbi:gliding motility-associated ABC transporter substrate-binding protein GldG [Nonlabens tegetincola]|uniref:gliding motility-associated ABC transporter substrate-binding protein GldG n=1 Tax=Nonlabens tegetincola TaxID=323273 RepID=UPI0030C8BAD3